MLESARAVAVSQSARQAAALDKLDEADFRSLALESFRRRNALCDGVFYDVGVIADEEAKKIGPWYAAEGSILIVPPVGGGVLALCRSVDDFVNCGGESIRTIAVAGVGSSALGSAAYARNVADAIGEQVAAVVSGYGLSDLLTEAMGGYFLFGQLNGLRHLFEGLDHKSLEISGTDPFKAVRQSKDTATLLALLRDRRFRFDLITGHSKGNLVLAEALWELRETDKARCDEIGTQSVAVTVSARIAFPPNCKTVIDVMGAWDWFGALNSRLDIKSDVVVPKAGHHTNTELPAHLDVMQVFDTLKKAGRLTV